jgi:uncharacterized protein (TIGR03382 family)
MFAASFSANAIVIKQNIFDSFGDQIGSVSVEVKQNALNTGVLDTTFGDHIKLVEFELGGLYSWSGILDVLFFEAVIDTDNLSAGLDFFSVDSNDVGFGALTWAYQLNYDAAFGDGFLDVFDLNGFLLFADVITFGAAEVSAPSTIGLAALALGVVLMRRKRLL